MSGLFINTESKIDNRPQSEVDLRAEFDQSTLQDRCWYQPTGTVPRVPRQRGVRVEHVVDAEACLDSSTISRQRQRLRQAEVDLVDAIAVLRTRLNQLKRCGRQRQRTIQRRLRA